MDQAKAFTENRDRARMQIPREMVTTDMNTNVNVMQNTNRHLSTGVLDRALRVLYI